MSCRCSFFIVGAPKAGTTTLARYLSDSPLVCFSNPKEVNYFSADEIKAQSLYYADPVVSTLAEYHQAFQPEGSGQVWGEGSVSYLFYPEVPRKIHNYNPCAKIVVMVRNPIDRAFSHYLMDSRLGYVKNSFEDIFYRKDEFPVHFQQYFKLGMYGEQVERYINQFGRDQVLVVRDSDLRDSPEATLSRVFSFIGVEATNFCASGRAHNEYKAAKNPIIKRLYQSHAMRVLTRKFLSRGLQHWLKTMLFTKKDKPVIGESIRGDLQKFYHDDVERLSVIVGSEFSKEWQV